MDSSDVNVFFICIDFGIKPCWISIDDPRMLLNGSDIQQEVQMESLSHK